MREGEEKAAAALREERAAALREEEKAAETMREGQEKTTAALREGEELESAAAMREKDEAIKNKAAERGSQRKVVGQNKRRGEGDEGADTVVHEDSCVDEVRLTALKTQLDELPDQLQGVVHKVLATIDLFVASNKRQKQPSGNSAGNRSKRVRLDESPRALLAAKLAGEITYIQYTDSLHQLALALSLSIEAPTLPYKDSYKEYGPAWSSCLLDWLGMG